METSMKEELYAFCHQHLSPTNTLLVPQLPSQGYLLFQDIVYDSYEEYDIEDAILVAVDIFKTKNRLTANVRFRPADDVTGYKVLRNKNLATIVDFVSMCSGRGAWPTKCGQLVNYVMDHLWSRDSMNRLSNHILVENRDNPIAIQLVRHYFFISSYNKH